MSRFCDYPADVARLPRVGGFVDPSIELILGLHPDLVVGMRSPANRAVVSLLEARGVPTWFPEGETVDDTLRIMRELGARIGSAREANQSANAISEALERLRRERANRPHPRVVLAIDTRPLFGAGRGTFPAELLEIAGGTNAVTEPGFPALSHERVAELAPDVIIEAAHETVPFDWSPIPHVPAVRDARIIRLDDVRILRPGPRLADAARSLASAIDRALANRPESPRAATLSVAAE